MKHTYIASDNSASDAQVLGAAGEDVKVYQILFGAPTAGKITNIYNKRVAYGHASGMGSVDSSNIAYSLTQPTAAAGNNLVYSMEFPEGLLLDGGSVHTDDDKVTIIWEEVQK